MFLSITLMFNSNIKPVRCHLRIFGTGFVEMIGTLAEQGVEDAKARMRALVPEGDLSVCFQPARKQ
jgi:hypothetical protein